MKLEAKTRLQAAFPYDVDHMGGAIGNRHIKHSDVATALTYQNWKRETNEVNTKLFNDDSDSVSDAHYEKLEHNGVVWAIWDKNAKRGVYNRKGQKVKL